MPTKKDFQATADILRKYLDSPMPTEAPASIAAIARESVIHALARDFAEHYKAQNPRFDTKRFLTACGIE